MISSLAPQTDLRHKISVDGADVEQSLVFAFRLIELVETLTASFGELGDIDLPPVVGTEAEQADLRVVAPLYLASELEAAGLIPAIELLAGLFASGGLSTDLGPAAMKLAVFWRGRNDRFTAQERMAFFSRLFGITPGPVMAEKGGRNRNFESLMTDLTEALYKMDEHPVWGQLAGPYQETRLRTAARTLAANLVPRSGGMTAFAARDILETTREALEILIAVFK